MGFHAVSNIGNIEPDGYDIDRQSMQHVCGCGIERKCCRLLTGALATANDVFHDIDGINPVGVRYRILSK